MKLKGFARSFFLPVTHAFSAISRNSTKIFSSHIRRSPQSTPLQNHCHAASRHNCIVVGNIHELMEHILRYADSDTLLVCTAVNRMVSAIAREYYWSTALNRGIRPILKSLSVWYEDDIVDAEYKRRREWFSKPPSPTHWQPFLISVGQHIRELTLDFGTRPVTHWFLERLLESCPSSVELPKLTTLRVIVNESAVELALAARFFQATVTTLNVDIREPLPKKGRALQVMQRDASPDIPTFSDHAISDMRHHVNLRPFFEQVSLKMPDLNYLSLYVHDGEQMAKSWSWFSVMVNTLALLHTLTLPSYALVPGLLAGIHAHPALQRILAFDTDTSSTPEPFLGQPYIDRRVNWSGGHIPRTLTHLAIAIHPSELVAFLHKTHGLDQITHLHILFTEHIPHDANLTVYFARIADACPRLEDLHVTPLMHSDNAVLQLSYRDLQPLAQCVCLEALHLRTQYTSCLTDGEFEALVRHWPQLERLELDHATVICPDPEETAGLSLGSILRTLSKHCLSICHLALYASPTVDALPFTPNLPHLQTLTLCLGLPVSPNSYLPVSCLLREALPSACVLKWDHGNRSIFDVIETDTSKWRDRKQLVIDFVRAIDNLRSHIDNIERSDFRISPLSLSYEESSTGRNSLTCIRLDEE